MTVGASHPVREFFRLRWAELIGACAFLAFVVWPMLRPSRLVEGFDTYAYSTPNDAVTFRALEAWHLPQWNPTIFGGVPHLANPQAGVFNPLKLPFVTLEPWRAVVLITVLHLFVLMVGMVALAHRLRLRPPAGFVAAAVLIGSGMVAGKSLQYPQVTVLAGIPWLLFTIDLALDGRGGRPRRALAWLALATAFLLVSGHPQITLLAFALGGAWAISRAFRHQAWRELWRVAAGVVLGAAVAAVQLLPSIELLSGAAERAATFINDPLYVVHRSLLPVTLLGDVFAPRVDLLAGSGDAMSYIGAAAAAVALLGVVDSLRRTHERAATVVLLITCAVAFWLSWGGISPLYRAARDVVPLFDQARVPARWIILLTFIGAIFAAQGTDAAVRRRLDRRTVVTAGVVLVVSAVVISLGPFETPVARTSAAWVAAVAASIGACCLVAMGRGRWPVVGVVVLAAVVVVELGAMARHAPLRLVSVPAGISSTTGPVVDHLLDHPGRVMSLTQERFDDATYMIEGLRPNVNATLGIRSIDGYDGGPQVRADWIEAARALTDDQVNTELTMRAMASVPLDPELYARLGVRWALVETDVLPASTTVPDWDGPVVTAGTTQLFENPSWTGDAFLYHATRRVARRPSAVLRRMDDVERRSVALVDADGPRLRCVDPCERTPVRVRRERPEHLVVRTRSPDAALLAVTEQHDPGWSAEVDGDAADIVKVDGFMLGVLVPPGTHDVTLRYRAPGLRAGAVVSLVALAVVGFLLFRRPRPRAADGRRVGSGSAALAEPEAPTGVARPEREVAREPVGEALRDEVVPQHDLEDVVVLEERA